MKKFIFLSVLLSGFFLFNTPAFAQNKAVTTQTATQSKGYTVVNPGEPIIIYKYVHKAHSPKEAEKYTPKYFFVTGSNNVLKPLTKADLKKSFPSNHAFHDALDANFSSDAELVNYDDFHKMYKINRLYTNSTVSK